MSNVSITLAIFSLAMVFSFVLITLLYVFVVLIVIGTLGIALLVFPGLGDFFTGKGPLIEGFAGFVAVAAPYVFVGAIATAIVSLVCLLVSERREHLARIIFEGVLIGIVVLAVIFFVGGAYVG
jgi:hypothetical protein